MGVEGRGGRSGVGDHRREREVVGGPDCRRALFLLKHRSIALGRELINAQMFGLEGAEQRAWVCK